MKNFDHLVVGLKCHGVDRWGQVPVITVGYCEGWEGKVNPGGKNGRKFACVTSTRISTGECGGSVLSAGFAEMASVPAMKKPKNGHHRVKKPTWLPLEGH